MKNTSKTHPLLDGAARYGASMSKESIQLSVMVKDPPFSHIARIETFEDDRYFYNNNQENITNTIHL